ncbi:T9SS type A sorting domain-containing protein [Ulvibacter sp.]|nr:T9SS type A sorting domain-containing protein [Ulvibacter sp.]
MKNILLTLLIFAGLAQTTQAQVGCDDMNLIVNVGSIQDYVDIYHPGHYLTSPREDNVITWTITDDQDNIVVEETLTNEAFFAFNHNVPITDTMNVSVVLRNETAGVACLIQDVLYWEETEVIPGVFTYSWAFLYGNVGTLGIDDVSHTTISIYPNPVSEMLYVDSSEPIKTIKIFNKIGQLVRSNSNYNKIDTENMQSGLYIVHVYFENGQSVIQKLIKE